jgi:hypothetical protein
MIARYREIAGFEAFNAAQQYLCAVLSLRLGVNWRITEAVLGRPSADFNDYPDRPNYGKWVVSGTHYPHDYNNDNELKGYNVSGRTGTDNINDCVLSACEWDSPLGPVHHAEYKYRLSMRERVLLIDAARTGTLNAFQAELLPDMEKYGFIKEENGKKIPAVPYITRADEKIFFDAESAGGDAFCRVLLDEAVKMCRESKVPYPPRIPFADEHAYTLPLNFLPMAYAYEAARRGVITIEAGKYYPVMYLVWK